MRSIFVPMVLAVLYFNVMGARAETDSAATLTLDAAVRLALTHNPALAIARLELQAMEAAELQAGVRPNPELGVLVEDSRSANRTTTVQLSQAIELGGKRAARLSFAARGREQAVVALQAKQAELRAAVAQAFFEVLGVQEQLRLTQAVPRGGACLRQARHRRDCHRPDAAQCGRQLRHAQTP
jgi:cobalt-zinc-cadmium efflux system outer membrane protein